jgi:hypothetical protein
VGTATACQQRGDQHGAATFFNANIMFRNLDVGDLGCTTAWVDPSSGTTEHVKAAGFWCHRAKIISREGQTP